MTRRCTTMFFLSLFLGAFWYAGNALPAEEKQRGHVENVKPIRREPLPDHAIARLGTLCLRQNGYADAVAYSPDGKTLASLTEEGTIHLWDAGTGEQLWVHSFQEAGTMVGEELVFSPDGKQMAIAAGKDGMLLLDLATKRSRHLSNRRNSIAFSPDSKLAVGVADRAFVIFDVKTCTVKLRLQNTNTPIPRHCNVAFSPKGDLVATWEWTRGKPSIIRLWDVSSGELTGELKSRHGFIRSLKFSPDGKLLATADPNTETHPCLWDVTKKKEIATVDHPGASLAVFSPNGKLLATCDEYRVRLWDTATWKELRSIETVAAVAGRRSLAFSPDGKKLLTAGNTHVVELWDVETGRPVFPSPGHPVPVVSLKFSPDGKILASHDAQRTVCLWNITNKKESHRLQVVNNVRLGRGRVGSPGCSLVFSPDGKSLAALSGADKKNPSITVRVWDSAIGRNLFGFRTSPARPNAIHLSPDAQVLATEYGGTISLWSMASRELVRKISGDEHGPLYAAAFAPDGHAFAATGRKRIKGSGSKTEFIPEILLWDWTNGQLIREFPSPKYGATFLTFSPDGHMLASCWHFYMMGNARKIDDTIRLWEPATGTLIRTLEGHGENMACVAFSPDGRLLASACPLDRTVSIWDVFTGKELAKFTGHRGFVYCVAFSPDGKTVASGSADTTVLLWDVSHLKPDQTPSIPRKEMSETLARLWEQMQAKEGAKAYQAIGRLLGAGDEAVAFFERKLQPVSAPDAKRINQAVADLDSEDFAKREAGTVYLAKLGMLAEPALRQALKSTPALETRKRIERLLAEISQRSSTDDADLRQTRALHALELIGSPAARELLKKLADGTPGARLTRDAKLALQRLERRPAKP